MDMRALSRLMREGWFVRCYGVADSFKDARYLGGPVGEWLRAVGRELMRNHLKHCATGAIREGGAEADRMYEELLDLMYRQVR